MTVAAPKSKTITDLVWARALLLDGINWYRGEIPDHPPTLSNDDRVAPYAVLYPFPGKPGDQGQADLAGAGRDIDWGGQLTIAAGYCEDCEYAVDKVHAWFFHWQPVIDGVAVGWLAPPIGFTPAPITPSREIVPPRHSTVLQFRLTATAN